jgi:hypothetical protein
MTAQARLSKTGEVVVPREVVAGQGWTAETELELVSSADGLLIRPKAQARETISWDEFDRRRSPHPGPPPTEAELAAIIEREATRRYLDKERRSR